MKWGGELVNILRHECAMFLWCFDVFFARVFTQVKKNARGEGLKLKVENGIGWEIKQIIYADDSLDGRSKRKSRSYFKGI